MSAAAAKRRVPWGQNFLVVPAVARAIVEWAGVDRRRVLEIGPGRGALTGEMIGRVERLWLVEIDRELAGALRARYQERPEVCVIEADATKFDFEEILGPPLLVIGNLPYESGTAIVSRLLDRRDLFVEMVFMLQREVCERLAAVPGSPAYGMLSIHTQLRADVELGRRVAPSCFRPVPSVESRLVRLRPMRQLRFRVADERIFAALLRRAFSARRKMVRNSLGTWIAQRLGQAVAAELLAVAGIDARQRPATIPIEAYAALSSALSDRGFTDA